MRGPRLWCSTFALTAGLLPAVLHAQSPAPKPAPNDTPSIKVGATIFADFTYTQSPLVTDIDTNRVHLSQFNVTRAYINITGNISHLLAFRITPDIARESGTGASLNGSLEFRLKYAFAQLNLDDWISKGSWVRLGIQQTPWVDYEEGIYRYRFQGTVFSEREGFLSSSDAGLSAHYNLPSNYGDIHVGIYNGETYSRPELNDQKAIQARVSVRPFAKSKSALYGLRLNGFVDDDDYVGDADRNRFIGSVTFEHKYLNAGFEYLKAHDRLTRRSVDIESNGYSIWATPRTKIGFEGLLRYDHLDPNTLNDAQHRSRFIGGIAYWLPHMGNVSSAFMLDYEEARFEGFTPVQATQKRFGLHGLVSF